MSWTPRNKIIDTRFIGRNILQFVKDNDEDALNWANGGTNLKEFQQFSESIANRSKPIFPSVAIVADSNATNFDSDLLASGYEITLEVMVHGAVAADVPLLARRYKHALESLLRNIPSGTLLTGTSTVLDSRVSSIETQFDELKTNDMQNSFLQMFQTKVVYMFYTQR